MPRLSHNIAANIAGNFVAAAASLLAVPFYANMLGIESFGLIGFYMTLTMLISIFDMGLSTTLNREMARLQASGGDGNRMRDMFRTLEMLYFAIAVVVGSVLALCSGWIAAHWLKLDALSTEDATRALRLMTASLCLQWLTVLYTSGMLGLQRQVRLNVLLIVFTLVRVLGALALLRYVGARIDYFFLWSLLAYGVYAFVLRGSCLVYIPAGSRGARFDRSALNEIKHFAAGMAGVSIFGLLLSQCDKIILTRIVPLEVFGYYTLAWVVASGLGRFVGPIITALYPRMTHLWTMHELKALARLFQQGYQLLFVLLIPPALVIVLYSDEVIFLWTQDVLKAERAAATCGLLTVAVALSSLYHPALSLQYASGKPRIAFLQGLVGVLVMPLVILVAGLHYGTFGVGLALCVYHFINLLVGMECTFSVHLPYGKRRWYLMSNLVPLCVVLPLAFLARSLFAVPEGFWSALLFLGMVYLLLVGASVLSLNEMRRLFAGRLLTRMRGGEAVAL